MKKGRGAFLAKGRVRAHLKEVNATGSAGIYLQFYLASAVMQFAFWILMLMRHVQGIESGTTPSELADWSTFAVTVDLGLGWVMLVAFGTCFSLWPLLYQTRSFPDSLPRAVLWINIGGQALIFIAHLLIISHPDAATKLLTMATTMICTSVALAAYPALITLRHGEHKKLENSGFMFIPVIVAATLSFVTMVVWLTRTGSPEMQFFTEGLYLLFNIDLLWMSAGFVSALGHFDRRLEWPVLTGWRQAAGMQVLLTLFVIHGLVMVADHAGLYRPWWVQLTFVPPLLWMFVMLYPVALRQIVKMNEVCSRPVMASVLWLPIIAMVATYEAMYTNTGLYHARYLLLFGVGLQSLFGFAIWYHQDHRRQPLRERHTPWVFLIALNISLIVHTARIFAIEGDLDLLEGRLAIDAVELGALLAAMITWLGWWIWEVLFSLNDWHRMPMFYDTLHQTDDPYGLDENPA